MLRIRQAPTTQARHRHQPRHQACAEADGSRSVLEGELDITHARSCGPRRPPSATSNVQQTRVTALTPARRAPTRPAHRGSRRQTETQIQIARQSCGNRRVRIPQRIPAGICNAVRGHHSQAGSPTARVHFACEYFNARLPSWYYWVVTSVKLVGLLKRIVAPGRTPDTRPIGVGSNRRRAWTGQLADDHSTDFADILWPSNVAVGVKAGIPKMLFALRAHMEANPSHILLKLDFTNAFNTMSRAAIIQACLNEPRWRKFVKFIWVTLSPASHVQGIPALSWKGVQQGDAWTDT